MKRLWLTIAALLLAAGPASAQFNTRGTQSYRNALTANNEFGVPRFTTTLLPSCSANNLGAIAWDTTASAYKICDASSWVEVGGGIAVGDDNDWTGTQTFLDNKLVFKDGAAVTATMVFLLDDITAGQQSIITVPDTDFTLAGLSIANIFTAANTFGSAAAAADSFVTGASSIVFEGATADDFELTLTLTDPDVDSTFTIGYSPDGNPWIGAGAGDACGSACTDDVFLGENAGGAANATSTGNTCIGDAACSGVTTGDNNVAVGINAGDSVTGGSTNTVVGRDADSVGDLSGITAVGYIALVHAANGVALGNAAETADGVSIGAAAGDAQGAADVDNVFVGSFAGSAANGTSTDNVCVGDLCLDLLTSGDRVAAVGANTDVGTNTDSDVTVVGESMVGKNSDSYLDGFGGRERCFTQGTGKALTESTPTAFVRISVATESYTGAWIRWRILADDGTDYQALSGESVIDVVNKANAETCVIRTLPAFGAAVEAASASTLALEADPACATAAADTVDVSLDAVSGLTQTSLNVFYTICVDGPLTTITPQ